MSHGFRARALLVLVSASVALSVGCSKKSEDASSSTPTGAGKMSNNIKSKLVDNGFSDSQAQAIADAGKKKGETQGKTNYYPNKSKSKALLAKYVGRKVLAAATDTTPKPDDATVYAANVAAGALAAIKDQSMATADAVKAAKLIAESVGTSLKDANVTALNADATKAKQAAAEMYKNLGAACTSSLDNAGLAAADIAKNAGAVAGSLLKTMDNSVVKTDGTVDKDTLKAVMGPATQGVVGGLAAAGISDAATLMSATKDVVKGSVAALGDVAKGASFSATEIKAELKDMTKEAVSAAEALGADDNSSERLTFGKEVLDGVSDGLAATDGDPSADFDLSYSDVRSDCVDGMGDGLEEIGASDAEAGAAESSAATFDPATEDVDTSGLTMDEPAVDCSDPANAADAQCSLDCSDPINSSDPACASGAPSDETTELEGTWAQPCLAGVGSNAAVKTTIVFSGSGFNFIQENYGNSTCMSSDLEYTINVTGSFSIVDEAATPAGAFKIDYYISEITATPNGSNSAGKPALDGTCSVDSTNDEAIDITGKSCAGITIHSSGGTYHDVYQITNGTTFFTGAPFGGGAAPYDATTSHGSSDSTRASTLQTTGFTKQ